MMSATLAAPKKVIKTIVSIAPKNCGAKYKKKKQAPPAVNSFFSK
jgi:hypothetical protein